MRQPPREVIDIAESEFGDIEDSGLEFEEEPCQNLLFRNMLVIPDEEWDWTEAVHYVGSHNLIKVFEGQLLGGPRSQIFEKEDATKPAYVVLITSTTLVWVEWK